jgi:hypothetical protein
MTWLDELAALWIPDDPVVLSDELRAWLNYRHEVTLRLAPERIVEIGVRAGYSAFAMLSAAPSASWLGIDVRLPNYNFADFDAESRRVLARFPGVEFLQADSTKMDLLPEEFQGADVIHIDGDHSERGCRSDLELAQRSGVRWALVDDVDFLPAVRRAVVSFVVEHDLSVEWRPDGIRGSALVELQ